MKKRNLLFSPGLQTRLSAAVSHLRISLGLIVCAAFVIGGPTESRAQDGEFTIKYFDLTKGRLAFSYAKKPGDKNTDIYVLDFLTLEVTPLATGPTPDEYPSWSPDGRKLAFYSDTDGNRDIFVINSDGSGRQRLTTADGPDEDPDWSPDGGQIVFHSSRDGAGTALYTMKADGSEQTRLEVLKKKKSGVNSVPRWSPRGNEILFSTNEYWPGWDVALFDTAERKTKLLTNGYQSFCRGAWHPTGSSFAFSYGSRDNIDIWIYEKGSQALKPLLTMPGREYDAVWTEDGKRLFFVGERTPGEGDFHILVWTAETGKIEPVLAAPGVVRYLSWTPLPSLKSLEEKAQKEAPKGQPSGAGLPVSSMPPAGAAAGAPLPVTQ